MICVYQIRNTSNNKIYIGSTKNFHKRKFKHLNDLRKGRHHNIYLQRCWNKTNDEELYIFEVLEKCATSELFDKEYEWINNKNPEYNIGGVGGGDNFTNHPNKEELRKQLAQNLLEAKRPAPKFKQDNPNWRGGTTFNECPICGKVRRTGNTPKTCASCRIRTGEQNPFYGKKHSEETKNKIRRSNLGKKPVNSQSVIIDGVKYESLSDAAKAVGVCPATISNRIKKGIYPS